MKEILINPPKEDIFKFPDESNKLLLHSCCAPCSGPLLEKIKVSGIELTILFYNPNIHPKAEYEIRKSENKRFADKLGIEVVDLDYDVQNWFARAKGMEYDPERGARCSMCFDMRFVRTALYAYEHGFSVITSSLGISRWKDMDQINRSGVKAAQNYPGIIYWTYNWRKDGGSDRMYELAKEENFYQQEYCGCIFSLRDSNILREKNGRSKIDLGKKFYSADIVSN